MITRNFGTVVPDKLYRGAQPTDAQFAELKALGVEYVIDLREKFGRESEVQACEDAGLVHINVPIGATMVNFGVLPPTGYQVAAVLGLISKHVCFVHCEHGEDRTGAIIAAYRMSVDKWTNAQALAEAQAFHLNPLQVLIHNWIEDYKPDPHWLSR